MGTGIDAIEATQRVVDMPLRLNDRKCVDDIPTATESSRKPLEFERLDDNVTVPRYTSVPVAP